MPNWCMNRLTVGGLGHGRIAALWSEQNVFSKVIPQPETFSEEDLHELEKHSRSTFLRPTHITAEDAWWWWRNKNWGIKWDVDEAEVAQGDDETVITFATAWSPPKAGLQNMSASYPDLRFVLVYCEPGEHFAGRAVFGGGRVISDHCHHDGQEYQDLAAECGCEDEEDEEEEAEEEQGECERPNTEQVDWLSEGF